MDDLDQHRRATSFGSQAEDYSRYRPAPPVAGIEWAIGANRATVVDLAAGTGNVTAQLDPLCERVVAVDLDPRMLAVLGARLPDIPRLVGRGEAVPVRSGSADAVAISSAWHWLDHDRAWPELARVIRPGGVLALLWSGPDRTVPWVAQVLGHRDGPESRTPGWWTRSREVAIPEGAPFASAEERAFTDTIPFAVADLPRVAASYSRLIVLSPDERRVALDRLTATMAARPELDGRDTIDLPLRCRVWRAVRTG